MPSDLDQGGQTYQWTKVWMGPSLGWVYQQVHPILQIVAAGTYTLGPNTSVVTVNVAGLVTLNLPDVVGWLKEPVYSPMVAFERSIWIKDIGGNAGAFNITVNPFGSQTIDALVSTPFTLIQNRAILRLYPLADQSGWFQG